MGRKKKDPHYARESRIYKHPVPSREFILEALKKHEEPLSYDALLDLLSIKGEEETEGVRRRVIAMLRDGQLDENTKGGLTPVHQSELIKGRIQGHKQGYGFLIPESGEKDLFLSRHEMAMVLPGDIVLARQLPSSSGKPEARIIEVLERNTQRCVARYIEEGGEPFLEPADKAIAQDFLLDPDCKHDAKSGDYVLVELIEQPSKRESGIAKIVDVLGDENAPGLEIHLAASSYDLPVEWPEAVLQEAKAIPDHVSESDCKGRKDYRKLPFVTIDGEDARDFDDAVCCEKTDNGWLLYVAIADVSHYVSPGSALDEEAQARGNSVYFPTLVIPMLPENLSNGICSLRPDVDRLVLVAEMAISQEGKCTDVALHEGVIHSHARITYGEAMAALDKESSHPRIAELQQLQSLFDALLQARKERGAIDFDVPSPAFSFDERGKLVGVGVTHRCDTHRIIEEAMLAANVSVADWLAEHKVTALHRVHDTPDEAKVALLRPFLNAFGLRFKRSAELHPSDYGVLLNQVAGKPEAPLVQTVLLRSLKQAVYSPSNMGHFGLAYDRYCHFTSPIRRYPDLLVHRAIKSILRKEKKWYPYDDESLEELGGHCSHTERRADHATRDAMDRLQCEFMKDRVGETFAAKIVDVTRFGMFIECEELHVKGLIHISTLGKDYYEFQPENYRLVGERTGQTFSLGDPISVRLAQVNLAEAQMEFVLEGAERKKKGRNR